ncbi:MAG: thermonuclease family protein, partial [Thermoleophilia bacterium]|nr:thermonuclease family protein [Thermoleophilia bacterium]
MSLVRVIDGDTIVVRMPDGHTEKVRYLGVDTPETVHPEKPVEPMGEEAAAFNRALVEAGPLRLELDVQERDQYG